MAEAKPDLERLVATVPSAQDWETVAQTEALIDAFAQAVQNFEEE